MYMQKKNEKCNKVFFIFSTWANFDKTIIYDNMRLCMRLQVVVVCIK